MKILLLGDASNYHSTLASALVAKGHEVTIASHGSYWMNTKRTIDISRKKGKISGAWLWLRLNTVLASQLKGYDVVQISNPIFVNLRPHRVRGIFDKLKKGNGKVFLTALGTDTPYVRMCIDPAKPLRYNEYSVDGSLSPFAQEHPMILRNWVGDELSDHCKYIYDNIDGAVAALYEYYLSCSRILPPDKLAYAGIPIDIPKYSTPRQNDRRFNILMACHKGREVEKGADKLLQVLRQIERDNKQHVRVDYVQNMPFAQFKDVLDHADIVVDQLYSYTPATTALMAMARGKVVVSGGEREYYDFIGERDNHPIINANPLSLESLAPKIQKVIDDPMLHAELSSSSRAFAKKHNSADVVADRFIEFWKKHRL